MSENTTYPGINKAAKLDFLNNEEKKNIRNISRKYWYVTRIERKDFATFRGIAQWFEDVLSEE